MKKNKIVVMGIVMMMLHTTGCGSQIPDMTEEQSAAISEYAVDLMLKYNVGNESRLVDLSLLDEEPKTTQRPQVSPTPTRTPEEAVQVEDTTLVESDEVEMTEDGEIKVALGLPDSVSFEYVDCQLVDSYKDQAAKELIIEAEAGNKLLVCNFIMVNDGSEKQSIDMLKDNIKYSINADGSMIPCSVTMLSDDLTTYLGILDTDESQKVVIITEGQDELLSGAENIFLQVEREETTATVRVK